MLGTCYEYVILTVVWRLQANTFVQASGGMSAKHGDVLQIGGLMCGSDRKYCSPLLCRPLSNVLGTRISSDLKSRLKYGPML